MQIGWSKYFTPNFTGYVRVDLLTMRKGDLEEMQDAIQQSPHGIESTNYESKTIGKGGKPEKILLDPRRKKVFS